MTAVHKANLIGVVVTVCLVLVGACLAHAHDHANTNLDQWYGSLKSEGGGPCCDGPEVDAIKLSDPDWRIGPNGYQVKLDGPASPWIDIPDDRVVKEPNRAGPAIVWPGAWVNGVKTVRCFLAGSGA